MRRFLQITVLFLVVGLLGLGVRHGLKLQAKKKREAAYQSALLSYTQVLKPGMTRKEVEDYFRARDVQLGQMCCVAVHQKHSLDDIIWIGHEDATWFCSDHGVFVAFEFEDRGHYESIWGADEKDTLKAVSIYHHLDGCL